MKIRALPWLLVSALSLTMAISACSSDDPAPTTGQSGSSGTAGTGGSSGTAGTGTAGTGTAGTGTAGTGTAGTGTAGTGTAGTGGQSSFTDFAGCTYATATDMTAETSPTISVGPGFAYTPPCIRVKVGTMVNFKGNSGTHPLMGMVANGTQPNPITTGAPHSADAPITFSAVGSYGFYCNNHGSDTTSGGSMVGVVYVELPFI
jgi:plastocyanin